MTCLMCFYNFFFILVGLVILLKLFSKMTTNWCTSKVSLAGKTIIVTGANAGIGYEAALEFAKRSARVILACRNEARALEARDRIVKATENQNVVVKLIDFNSLQSVRNFAKDIIENEDRLDVLVNNAGIGEAENKLTEDGFDILMQVNYFGPFLLTLLLIEKLKESAPSRIVNLSSGLANCSKLKLDDLNAYGGKAVSYNNSKVCNVLHAMHLATLLEKYNITTYSVNPGAVQTEFTKNYTGAKRVFVDSIRPLFSSAEEGAQTTIYTALEQGIEEYSGGFFYKCKPVKHYSTARVPGLPKDLWDKTVELLKCEEEVKNL